jgi:hypothetical protein
VKPETTGKTKKTARKYHILSLFREKIALSSIISSIIFTSSPSQVLK